MATVNLHICDACGREERGVHQPGSWCEIRFNGGGALNGHLRLLCDQCSQTAFATGPLRVLLERRLKENERDGYR